MAGLKSHEIPAAHEVVKGDPRIDGPYLDDYNAAYDAARRELNLAGQESQKERYEADELDVAATEGTELGDGGTEERVLSETATTRTVVRTESKNEAPPEEDSDSEEDGGDGPEPGDEDWTPPENLENTDEGVDRPEGSTAGGEKTAGNNPSFNSDIEGSGSENV